MSFPRATSSSSLRFGIAVVVTGAVAIVTACGSSTSGFSCNDLSSAAAKDVLAVIDAHQSCTQASDCISVGLSASCFDQCFRVMSTDGTAALMAAQDKVDQNQCAQFKSQGCKFDVPPCAPPMPLTCVSGKCSGG